MHIVVSGWIGSTNLGDEFVFAGVRRALTETFGPCDITALSINPDETRALHHVDAVNGNDLRQVVRACRGADLLVFGGGGLIQHETSPFNLPYHLTRASIALAVGTPVVGLGLGVSPITGPLARRLVPLLRRFSGITVRDVESAAELARFGIDAQVACDTAWHTASILAPPTPVVSAKVKVLLGLRPWDTPTRGTRSLLPVKWAKNRVAVPYAPRLTATVKRLIANGYEVHGLVMQPGRDDHVYRAIDAPIELLTPTIDTLIDVAARHDVMVAMRYHAGVAATIAHTPSVLIGYSAKVTSLATTLGHGGRHLPFEPHSFSTLDQTISALLHDDQANRDVAHARHSQLQLRQQNVAVLRAAQRLS